MTAQSAAATIARIESGTDGWVAIGDFVDSWDRATGAERADLVARAPRHGDGTRRWFALVAAAVDHLARTTEADMEVPPWVVSSATVLAEPWFLLPGTALRMHQLVDTPAAFKARNIFGGDRILSRV
ncbi:MAG TPA: hypothetical protein VFY18_02015 [Candidatus Limnocylindrales bacterium]|nr:hypothetical protein [Candidatus Limnocylindrales bacterium]